MKRPLIKICQISTYIILCCAFLSCAAWFQHATYPVVQKKWLAVLPILSEVEIKKIKDIKTLPESNQSIQDEKQLIQEEMQNATECINDLLEKGLRDNKFFEDIPREQVNQALAVLGINSSNTPLTKEQIKKLGEELNTQSVLITRLSGYGKIKKKWLFFLIGSGVIEGTVEGIIAAQVVSNYFVALGVAAEEILQEIVVWGGGAFLFNKFFTPVIIEAELVNTVDGKVIWDKTVFATINRKGLKEYPEEERGKKELRLEVTLEKATDELLEEFNKETFDH